jgi:hypothetical protein
VESFWQQMGLDPRVLHVVSPDGPPDGPDGMEERS